MGRRPRDGDPGKQAHRTQRGEEDQGIEVDRAAARAPVQTAGAATRVPAVNERHRLPTGHGLTRPDQRAHRFVLGPHAVGVGHDDDAAPGDPTGERHRSGRGGAHDRPLGGGQVDAPVAGTIGRRSRVERAQHPQRTERCDVVRRRGHGTGRCGTGRTTGTHTAGSGHATGAHGEDGDGHHDPGDRPTVLSPDRHEPSLADESGSRPNRSRTVDGRTAPGGPSTGPMA